jgi:glycosyltransferase involved in cell wall biosynthesis
LATHTRTGLTVRVAHVVTNLDRGGAQQGVMISARLAPARDEVHLISGPGSGRDRSHVDEARRLLGARLHLVPSLVREVRPLADARAAYAIWRLCRRERFDVVHTHMSKGGVLGRLAARGARTPVVVHTAHGWSLWYSPRILVRHAVGAIERVCAWGHVLILVGSRHDESVAIEIGIPATKVRAVTFGIELGRGLIDQASARSRLGLAGSAPVVGTVTRLVATKRVEDFVRAAAVIRRRRPETCFLLVGSGPDEQRLRELARSLGIGSAIRFEPATVDVADALRALDVFVHTSAFEGLPRVVLEAMANEVPVVAQDAGATREVILDGHTGRLVPIGDVAALADAVVQLLADETGALGLATRARELVREHHDAATGVATQHEIYSQLRADAFRRKIGPRRSTSKRRRPARAASPRTSRRSK